jgi:hypothetical protein
MEMRRIGVISVDNVVGLKFDDGEIACKKCCSQQEWKEFNENEAITENETEGDDIYFCDRCKERI